MEVNVYFENGKIKILYPENMSQREAMERAYAYLKGR